MMAAESVNLLLCRVILQVSVKLPAVEGAAVLNTQMQHMFVTVGLP